MRTELTDFEVEYYRTNGFVAIQDLLDDDDLEHWRKVIESVAGAPSEQGLANIRGSGLSATNPDIAALWRNPAIGALVGQLGGFDAVRHWGDGISYVLQGHGATPWHCNMHEHQPFDSAEALSLYVPLDEFRWFNKALNFLPGAQKIMPLGVRTMTPSLRNASFGSLLEEYPALKQIEPVITEGRAGMGIFYNLLGVHGSAPNMTPRVRRSTGGQYCKADEVCNGLPWVNTGHGKAAGDEEAPPAGSPLPDDLAPVIWRRPA